MVADYFESKGFGEYRSNIEDQKLSGDRIVLPTPATRAILT